MENLEKRLSAEGTRYQNISAPKALEGKLEEAFRKANRARKFLIPTAVAAAALLLVIMPNTGAGMAHAMGSIPVVGRLFQAVTFRDYQYESERFNANVEVPQIVINDTEPTADTPESAEQLGETIKQINFDIEKTTEELVAQFEASAELGESYSDLEIHHEIVTDNDHYFALKLFIYQGAGSGFQSSKIYTVDKLSGQQIHLGDLFLADADYNTLLSENIREQMRTIMAADDSKAYWVDKEDIPALNWQGLKEDQNFYFDGSGNLVISFDEYEVAPGYMGAQEFTVNQEVYENLMK